MGRWRKLTSSLSSMDKVVPRVWIYELTMGHSGMVMMRTVAENRRLRFVRRRANSTTGTRLPIPGVGVNTRLSFLMVNMCLFISFLVLFSFLQCHIVK